MAKAPGRQRGAVGGSQEVKRLAELLQHCVRKAGLSVRALHGLLRADQFAPPRGVPSHAVLQRRLNGENLATDTDLIKAIIDVTTPESERGPLLELAEEFQRDARLGATTVDTQHDEITRLAHELADARKQLAQVEEELAEERRWREDLERRLGADSASPIQEAELHRLREVLHHAEQERDALRIEVERSRVRLPTSAGTPDLRITTRPSGEPATGPGGDPALDVLEEQLRGLDPDGALLAAVIRRALDHQYDGPHTGRYAWEQLTKWEKAAVGAKVEVEFQRAYDLADGGDADFALAGVEFDLKYSTRDRGWVIDQWRLEVPQLLITGNDHQSVMSAGLLRPHPGLLNRVGRDGRATLSTEGLKAVRWLHREVPLPENTLAHLTPDIRERVLSHRSGQQRVVELFRLVQDRPISTVTVQTVALQQDAMKRVRDASRQLDGEGVRILSGNRLGDQRIAADLGLPALRPGSFMSIRAESAGQEVAR
ncbi:NaeI family type II restriction endonuclease [Actinoplanes sp. OR16]|uniref:NaeI family type II restriction endonuclease n=1 Tax=Actinoplanes sp. OR16 TaxID=946334 RepID=UPI00135F1A27|nr:NaeI family type II restriction endonuclease [Actinoplanes sp. OR16]